jgi:hypothetical protein
MHGAGRSRMGPYGSFRAPAPGAAQFVPTLETNQVAPISTPLAEWSQPWNNRGQKRRADVELHRDRTSPDWEAEADLFLLENYITYSQSYVIQEYLENTIYWPDDWDALVGVFFMWSGINPLDVLWGSIGIQKWVRDRARIDLLEKNADFLSVWRLPERMKQEGLVHGKSVAIYLNKLPLEPKSLRKKMLPFPPPRAARSLRAALLPSNLHRKNLNGRRPLISALLRPIPTGSLRAALSSPLHRKIPISHGHQLRKTTRMQQKTILTQSIPLMFSIRTLTTTSVLPLL